MEEVVDVAGGWKVEGGCWVGGRWVDGGRWKWLLGGWKVVLEVSGWCWKWELEEVVLEVVLEQVVQEVVQVEVLVALEALEVLVVLEVLEVLEEVVVHLPSPPDLRNVSGYKLHFLVSVSLCVSWMASAHRLGADLRLHTPGWNACRFPLWQTACTHHKTQHL